MTDETTSATAVPADVEEAAALLAELRVRVEEAAVEIERLTAELVDRSQALDELETIMDAVLGVTDTALILVGDDRRVRAMTRGAADLLATQGSQVGRPLSTVLPDDQVDTVAEALDAARPDRGDIEAGGGAATVRALPGGEALVVLRSA
jgi:nitrogen fixation/metabolism regulation signal transduction histidine kinase